MWGLSNDADDNEPAALEPGNSAWLRFSSAPAAREGVEIWCAGQADPSGNPWSEEWEPLKNVADCGFPIPQ